jgi:hypothetical protein
VAANSHIALILSRMGGSEGSVIVEEEAGLVPPRRSSLLTSYPKERWNKERDKRVVWTIKRIPKCNRIRRICLRGIRGCKGKIDSISKVGGSKERVNDFYCDDPPGDGEFQ